MVKGNSSRYVDCMDITRPTTAQPGTSIIATGPAAQTLTAGLGIRAHQTVSARVTGISVVSTAEKQAILASRNSAGSPPSPGSRALTEVVQSPDVRLIALTINGKVVHALSNLPLQLLQSVQVRLDAHGNLVLVPQNPPVPAGGPGAQNPAPHTSESPGSKSLLQMVLQSTSLRSQARSALATEINRTLPQAQPLHHLLNLLLKISDMPALASPVNNSPTTLHALLTAIPTLETLLRSPGDALRTALLNSGTFYENRIGSALPGSLPGTSAALPSDLKHLLIQLAQHLQASGSAAQGAAGKNSDTALDTFLRQLLQLVPARQTTNNQSDSASPLRRLESMVEAALSQVQLNQYRSASAQLGETGGTVQNSVFVDLPVRLADGFISVFLQLQEFKAFRRSESGRKERTTKKSRWVAFLEMEVRAQGKLAVELSVTDQQVDAVFWSDDEQLRRDADQNLGNLRQHLEDRGLTVTDLRCSPNAAPTKHVRLDYSLIDVKT